MDLNYIKTFLQVVSAGNFARAAEQLQYAQSTVTAQMHAIEQELGAPLFERVGRKNYLTPTGEEFLKYCSELQNILQKISGVGQQGYDAEFTLRIGVLQSLLFDSFLGTLPVIREKYPNATVTLKVCNTQELMELMRQHALDMAYISGPPCPPFCTRMIWSLWTRTSHPRSTTARSWCAKVPGSPPP